MPTISQLPSVAEVTAADTIPVSQGGETHSVSVGSLLASMQPAIINETGTLLGRTSLGPGGPEPVTVGTGLVLNGGTLNTTTFDPATLPRRATLSMGDYLMLDSDGALSLLPVPSLRGLFSAGTNISIDSAGKISFSGQGGSLSIAALPTVATIDGDDLIAINQGGTDHSINYANLLDGLTIDQAQPAAPAGDTDSLWVAQGSSTMLRQTFAALWAWLTAKQPTYKLPVVEIVANTTLDGTTHNGRILICSQPVILAPAPLNMGNGFHCDVLNLSGDNVTLGSGIITSSGSAQLPNGQTARIQVVTYSGGTVIFASFAGAAAGGTTSIALPGQVVGLAPSSPTSSSVTLNWSTPASGGAVSDYVVQYRVAGASPWSTFATGITSTSATVIGLLPATSYEFQVYALNGGGSGAPSAAAGATTLARPGNVTAISWLMVPIGPYVHASGSIGVNAQITPADAAVQFGFSTSASMPPATWVAATHVNSNLWGAYVSTPSIPGTWYGWVEGTDGSLPMSYPTPFTVS